MCGKNFLKIWYTHFLSISFSYSQSCMLCNLNFLNSFKIRGEKKPQGDKNKHKVNKPFCYYTFLWITLQIFLVISDLFWHCRIIHLWLNGEAMCRWVIKAGNQKTNISVNQTFKILVIQQLVSLCIHSVNVPCHMNSQFRSRRPCTIGLDNKDGFCRGYRRTCCHYLLVEHLQKSSGILTKLCPDYLFSGFWGPWK